MGNAERRVRIPHVYLHGRRGEAGCARKVRQLLKGLRAAQQKNNFVD